MLPSAILERIGLAGKPGPAAECARRASLPRHLIEDLRPMAQSLEWRLSAWSWARLGVRPFTSGEVPYLVNNDGRLSRDAAALFFINCLETEPPGDRIVVLELGAGTGLFARYFLDEIQLLCERESRDYYDRLRYLVTDGSPHTVQFWQEKEIFREHADHVAASACQSGEVQALNAGPVRAVFCNYVLDSLPAAVLRRRGGVWEQRCERTWITDDAALLRQYTALSTGEIRECAASEAPENLERILPLLPLLETEAEFVPVGEKGPPGVEELSATGGAEPFTYNYGALDCLETALRSLEPEGFILINDYDAAPCGQRFGPCAAIGLNFPLMEDRLRRAGVSVREAEGDARCRVHARLLLRLDLAATRGAFESRFSAAAQGKIREPAEQARRQAEHGLLREALHSYRLALERNPKNWQLIGDVAGFVAEELNDPATGVELARSAIELNPWYSPDLWNVLGDCLARLGRHAEAHECYGQAYRMHPENPRASLRLAGSWLRLGDPVRCLETIAQGLAYDSKSMLRHLLLEKQQEAIAALSVRWNREFERANRREAGYDSGISQEDLEDGNNS